MKVMSTPAMTTENNYFRRDISVDNALTTDGHTSAELAMDQLCVGDVGCVVWDAALVLAKYLDHNHHRLGLKGSVVVELGAGTGFCGIYAAALGSAHVVVTDLCDCVHLMTRNVLINAHLVSDRVVVKEFDWSQTDPKSDEFCGHRLDAIDYILVSDCLYYEQSVQHLYDTIEWLSSKGAQVLLSYEDRDDKQPLIDKFFNLTSDKFTVSEIPCHDLHPDYRSPDLHLFLLKQNI